jgi:hypothetical protein
MSSASRWLAGYGNDEKLGSMSATTYTAFNVATELSDEEMEHAEFTRAALFIQLDGYNYYDTINFLTLTIQRLSETIEPRSNGYFYNTQDFETWEEAIGKLKFHPRPHRTDTLVINLEAALSFELWSKFTDGDDEMSTSEKFTRYFKGVRITATGAGSGCILGISGIQLRLYYNDTGSTPVTEKHVSFTSNQSLTFTSIQSDRSATDLAGLLSVRDKVEASESDDLSFIQSGTGVAMRIDMPYLRNLAQLSNHRLIKAELLLYPYRGSYKASTPLPQSLSVWVYNKNNQVLAALDATCDLQEDIALGRDTHYSLDVTDYIKEQIEREELHGDGLVFTCPTDELRSTVSRFYVADKSYTYGTGLKAYFVNVNAN